MELDKKNVLKIIFIIFVSILLFSVIQNFSVTLTVIQGFLLAFSPFIIGFCMAFIFNIPMYFLENKVFAGANKKGRKLWLRVRRPICLVMSILFTLGILTAFMFLIIPEIKRTVITVVEELPTQVDLLSGKIKNITDKYGLSFNPNVMYNIDWKSISANILDRYKNGSPTVINSTLDLTSKVLKGMFNIILGFAFSIYLLSSKKKLIIQTKRFLSVLLPEKSADRLIGILSLSNRIFSKFIVGQCTEALILGTLCYIGMLIFSLPYALMIASLMAITALVPVFGAFIGAAGGTIIIFFQTPLKALWFMIFIFILQQFETNIIYPKVVGDSVGLPGIWVLFSVAMGGSLFGAAGMIVSVPLVAVAYLMSQKYIDKTLKNREALKVPATDKPCE